MQPNAFERQVLAWCGDDYEAPHTIAADMARELEVAVTEDDVRAAMLALADQGLLQAYVYDRSVQAWAAISPGRAHSDESAWFMCSDAGRRFYSSTAQSWNETPRRDLCHRRHEAR